MDSRERNHHFAVDFVAANGDGHPAALYLVSLFKDALDQERQEREQRFSTGSDWQHIVWQSQLISDCIRRMTACSTMLKPSELVDGYVRETMAGKLPVNWQKVSNIESSILRNGWNGRPLVTTRLTRISGEKVALNSGTNRLTSIRRLYEAGRLASDFRIPLFDMRQNWSWFYGDYLKHFPEKSVKSKIFRPERFGLQQILSWSMYCIFFNIVTDISGLQCDPNIIRALRDPFFALSGRDM